MTPEIAMTPVAAMTPVTTMTPVMAMTPVAAMTTVAAMTPVVAARDTSDGNDTRDRHQMATGFSKSQVWRKAFPSYKCTRNTSLVYLSCVPLYMFTRISTIYDAC